MTLAADTLDALYRYALATFYTSPSTSARYDFHAEHTRLIADGLIERTELGRFRPSATGWRLLGDALDADRGAQLRKLQERRARRPKR